MADAPHILAQGYPGTAKTGALAALLNTGNFRARVIDFENNLLPLLQYTRPEFHKNISVATCRDKLAMTEVGPISTKGTPTAFRKAWKLIDEFVGINAATGAEENLGPVPTWGAGDILVVDSTTQMSECGMRRVLTMMGRTTLNRRQQEWGVVQSEVGQYFDNLRSVARCPLYVITHLKAQSPKMLEPDDGKGNNAGVTADVAQEMNQRMMDAIPTRLVPTILGQALAGNFTGMFPVVLLFEKKVKGENVSLVIRTTPTPVVDVKVPAEGLAKELPVADGLLTIFNALHANGEAKS